MEVTFLVVIKDEIYLVLTVWCVKKILYRNSLRRPRVTLVGLNLLLWATTQN